MKIRTNTKTILNQNQAVSMILKNSRSKKGLTSEQICNSVNTTLAGRITEKLTVTQVSKCLNRFYERGLVKQMGKNAKFSNGRSAHTWAFTPTARRS